MSTVHETIQAHHHGPNAFGWSAGSATLIWVGNHIKAGYLIAAGVDFSQLCSDLAHLGGFLMAVAAVGTLSLNVFDRWKGRRK